MNRNVLNKSKRGLSGPGILFALSVLSVTSVGLAHTKTPSTHSLVCEKGNSGVRVILNAGHYRQLPGSIVAAVEDVRIHHLYSGTHDLSCDQNWLDIKIDDSGEIKVRTGREERLLSCVGFWIGDSQPTRMDLIGETSTGKIKANWVTSRGYGNRKMTTDCELETLPEVTNE